MSESDSFEDVVSKIRLIIISSLEKTRIDRHSKDYKILNQAKTLLDSVEVNQEIVAKKCSNFDFVDATGHRVKGNGYRSLLYTLQQYLAVFLKYLEKQSIRLDQSPITALCGLDVILKYAVRLMNRSEPSTLLSCESIDLLYEIMLTEDNTREVLYGEFLGFQYPDSLKMVMKIFAVSSVTFHKWWFSTDNVLEKILTALWSVPSTYFSDDRGDQIVKVIDNATVSFAKAFWSIPDEMRFKVAYKTVNQILIPTEVSVIIKIPAKKIPIETLDGTLLTFFPPYESNGEFQLPLLLISIEWRSGQATQLPRDPVAPSDALVIHIHGGGFIASSPTPHESYLRAWSRELNCPVVSIDYSLAPEAPYPQALEECVFAYGWILKNLDKMGSTGKKIIIVGDSSGGNLAITASMRLKTLNIRLPDHIFAFYPVTIVKLSATPSRLISLFDVILPFGVLLACLKAYTTGSGYTKETIQKRNEIKDKILSEIADNELSSDNGTSERKRIEKLIEEVADIYKISEDITTDPFVSPALAPDEMLKGLPPMSLICGALDPLLDDGIVFAQRLKSVDQPVTLKVVEGLPHGFLNFFRMLEEVREAKDGSIEMMKAVLNQI